MTYTTLRCVFRAPEQNEESKLLRLYSAFPGGLPGISLLLLRVVFAITLLVQGGLYLGGPEPTPGAWFVGLAALAAGILMLIGFLTPIVGTLVGVGAIGIGLSLLPASVPTLFDSRTPIVLAVTMLLTIIVLGPGAVSVDARIFGRREIIIPYPHSSLPR